LHKLKNKLIQTGPNYINNFFLKNISQITFFLTQKTNNFKIVRINLFNKDITLYIYILMMLKFELRTFYLFILIGRNIILYMLKFEF
jgi:hypothetical protein